MLIFIGVVLGREVPEMMCGISEGRHYCVDMGDSGEGCHW